MLGKLLWPIKTADGGRLWSIHYPRRKFDTGSNQFCHTLSHLIRNLAQETELASDDIAANLRSVLANLGVPETEFDRFYEEAKGR